MAAGDIFEFPDESDKSVVRVDLMYMRGTDAHMIVGVRPGLNAEEEVRKVIFNNSKLTCVLNRADRDGLLGLLVVNILMNAPVTTFGLHRLHIDTAFSESIARGVFANNTLKKLTLDTRGHGFSASMQPILNSICDHSSIEEFIIAQQRTTDNLMEDLSYALSHPRFTISKVEIECVELEDDDLRVIIPDLKVNTKIQRFVIRQPHLLSRAYINSLRDTFAALKTTQLIIEDNR